MAIYKEIVTKAVIGKGKKTSGGKYSITTDFIPDTVLGCWVINHRFEGNSKNGLVLVNGTFDINVWYSYDNDTKTGVSTKTFTYSEKMNIRLKDNQGLSSSNEIIVRSLRQPTVTEVEVAGGNVVMNVEKELGVEVVGSTKVKVSVEEEFDDYEIIEDEAEVTKEIEEKIDEEITEDYV